MTMMAKCQTSSFHSGQPHTESKIDQQTNKITRQTCAWQQLMNPHNPEFVQYNYIRKAEQHYSEQQILSSQHPVHLMMVSWAKTCSDIQYRDKNIN
jgi:hypothetical protein